MQSKSMKNDGVQIEVKTGEAEASKGAGVKNNEQPERDGRAAGETRAGAGAAASTDRLHDTGAPGTRQGEERIQRLAAEFANFKKRIDAERVELREKISNEIYAEILPIMDDFLRLQDHMNADSPLLEGISAIAEKWQQWMRKNHIERFAAIGEPFDPMMHDAVMQQPVTDAALDGCIAQVLEYGYRRGETMLRHAKVAVGRYESAANGDDEKSESVRA